MTRALLLAALLSVSAVTSALVQDPISTRLTRDVPPADIATAPALDMPTESQVEAAQWARDVLARASGQPPSSDQRGIAQKTAVEAKGCPRNPDRAVHGSAGVAVGSDGYRHADLYAEKAIGDCGTVAFGISTSEGGRRGHIR